MTFFPRLRILGDHHHCLLSVSEAAPWQMTRLRDSTVSPVTLPLCTCPHPSAAHLRTAPQPPSAAGAHVPDRTVCSQATCCEVSTDRMGQRAEGSLPFSCRCWPSNILL